jgi:hypothetical protein
MDRLAGLALLGCATGLALTLIAIGWWAYAFNGIASSGGYGNALSCLYSPGGICGFIAAVAQEQGRVAYSPNLFRLGVVLLIGGGIVRLALPRKA